MVRGGTAFKPVKRRGKNSRLGRRAEYMSDESCFHAALRPLSPLSSMSHKQQGCLTAGWYAIRLATLIPLWGHVLKDSVTVVACSAQELLGLSACAVATG